MKTFLFKNVPSIQKAILAVAVMLLLGIGTLVFAVRVPLPKEASMFIDLVGMLLLLSCLTLSGDIAFGISRLLRADIKKEIDEATHEPH